MDEKRLWLGVLLQAIKDVAGYDLCVKPEQRALIEHKARAWFYSRSSDAGSFTRTCDVLGLEADHLRRRIFSLIAWPDWTEKRRTATRHPYRHGRRAPAPAAV